MFFYVNAFLLYKFNYITIVWLISSVKMRDLFPSPAWLSCSSSVAEGVLVQPLFTRYIYILNGLLDLGVSALLWSGEKRFPPPPLFFGKKSWK